MEDKKALFFHTLLFLLSGLIIAFFTNLLVYFKQKEVLHVGVVLFAAGVFYFSGSFLQRNLRLNPFFQTITLLIIVLIGWLGPQFIYQVRPYTFYISGFALGCIVAIALASGILADQKKVLNPWKSVAFFVGFIIGYLISWQISQILVSVLVMVLFILFVIRYDLMKKLLFLLSSAAIIILYFILSKPMIFYEEQVDYEDKVLFAANTQWHKMVITQWKKDQWVYIDKLKNISSIDEYLFYEPMAHGVFKVGDPINDVLIIGGENGCLLREVVKHENVAQVHIISYDTLLRHYGMKLEYFTAMNEDSYLNPKVQIIHEDLLDFVSQSSKKYDAVFIDLPDPRSIETNQYYTLEFYQLIKNLVNDHGIVITQAGSPYFASMAYFSIGRTLEMAGFKTLPIHNQILTLGEWGWYICSPEIDDGELKSRLVVPKELDIETIWFNDQAAKLVSAFGKNSLDTMNPGINTLQNPIVYQYYLKGNWELN